MTLWLIGMMASGKSTVGRIVAGASGVPFHDTDDEVAAKAGCSIAELWENQGEQAFRNLEKEVVFRLSGLSAVVSTGGGAPMDLDSRATMIAGRVVWLRARPSTLAVRIGSDPERPLLAEGPEPEKALARLLAQREGVYAGMADVVIDTDDLAPPAVAERILEESWP